MSAHVVDVVDVVGWAIVHSLWQGAALALVLALLLAALRRRSPELRYVTACLALLLMVALPVATAVRGHARGAHGEAPSPAAALAAPHTPSGAAAPSLGAGEPSPTQSRLVVVRDAASTARRWLDQPLRDAFPALVLAWALGVALLSARLAGGWTLNRRLLHPAPLPVPGEWAALLRRLHGELRLRVPVRLALSARVAVPTVLGWLRPVVLFPASALSGLTVQQVELLLRHELAHVRRHDYLVNLLQSVAEVLLFHHPAAWWVSRRIRVEREHCCDDAVARAAGVPAYVRALVAMEALRPALAAAAAGRRPLAVGADGAPLLARVRRLAGLDARPVPAGARPAAPVVGLLAGALVVAALVAGARPGDAAPASRPVAAELRARPTDAPSMPAPLCAASATDSLTLCAPLTRRIERLLQESGAEGAVVVQDVRSGAVVSYAAASRLGDLDVGTAIVPASVWKLAIAALWWEHGFGDEPVACPATLQVGGRSFTNAGAAAASLTPARMLAQSCNTAAANMTLALRDRVGAPAVLDGLRRFGFPLAGASGDGTRDSTFWASSSAEWRARMSPAASVLRLDPGAGDLAWAELAVGQPRVRVTPLHVSRLLQAIGHDGVMRAPTVERRLAGREGGTAVMRPATARRLQEAMQLAVREGTARGVLPLLDGARWSLGGKTGTAPSAQPAAARADGWFVGLMFDERDAPRYTVVVHLRAAGSGGGAAARLAATLTRELGGAAD